MSELRGLNSMGVMLNPPYMGDWPRKIGQFILNFGAIELMSYQYLLKLESTRIDFNRNLNSLLKARIDRIIELIDHTSDIDENLKGELKQIWGDVKELSEWRNRIAHNPVLPTWKPGSDEAHSPPDLLGVPDMKQLKNSNISDSITLDGLDKLIDASAKLGKEIHDLYRKLNTTI